MLYPETGGDHQMDVDGEQKPSVTKKEVKKWTLSRRQRNRVKRLTRLKHSKW